MKYCRFTHNGAPRYGLIETVAGRESITRTLDFHESSADALDEAPSRRIDPIAFDGASLLAPVTPSKIVCVGRNYRDHAKELGHAIPVSLLT